MTRLVWDATGEHFYETGVKNGVLYVQENGAYPAGVAWNGLSSVSEKPSGSEANPIYADDMKYLNLFSAEEFGATVEAYTYPNEFAQCDGSATLATGVEIGQQTRKTFGMCYRTVFGNDTELNEYGYKLHMIYGAKASPSEKSYQTINDSPEAITLSWEVTTTPVTVAGFKPTASLVITSTEANAAKLKDLEAILYGTDAFSETKTYAIGDYVSHADSGTPTVTKLYRCKTAIATPGAWSDTSWDLVSESAGPRLPLPDEIKTLMTAPAAG